MSAAVVGAMAALVDYSWGKAFDPKSAPAHFPEGHTIMVRQLCNVRVEDGRLKADDLLFPAVTGNPATLAVMACFADGTSRLVNVAGADVDRECWLGLPVVPHGGDICVSWPRRGVEIL